MKQQNFKLYIIHIIVFRIAFLFCIQNSNYKYTMHHKAGHTRTNLAYIGGILGQNRLVIVYLIHFVILTINCCQKFKPCGVVLHHNNVSKHLELILYNLVAQTFTCWLFAIITMIFLYVLILISIIGYSITFRCFMLDMKQLVKF